MLTSTAIVGAAKAAIASNPKFQGVTPELEAILTAIADGVVAEVNRELSVMKVKYNLHVHAGPGAPPVPPL